MNWAELQRKYQFAREQAGLESEKTRDIPSTLAEQARDELLAAARSFLAEAEEIEPETVVEKFLVNVYFLIHIHEQCPSLRAFLFKSSKEIRFGRFISRLGTEFWENVVLSEKGVLFTGSAEFKGEEEYVEFSPEVTVKLWHRKTGTTLIKYFAKLTPPKILEKIWNSLEK